MGRIFISGKKVLEIGKLMDQHGWKSMGKATREEFIKIHRLKGYGIRPDMKDIDNKFIRASRNPLLWEFEDKLPPGIARVRELNRFRDKLRDAFEKGFIDQDTTREQLDRLYEYYFGKPIAPRH